MWVLFARAPTADMPYWMGRRWLAAMDALVWPGLWIVAVRTLPADAGLIGAFVGACAVIACLGRVYTALWQNHRYRFTTWRWAKVLGGMVLLGLLLHLFLGQ